MSIKQVLKIFILFFLLCFAVLFVIFDRSKFMYGVKYSFFNQPNSEWVSEKYGVRVVSHEIDEDVDLIILSDGKEYTYALHYRGNGLVVHGIDYNDMVVVERWSARYYRKKVCITVRSSEFFEEGEKITLYLVED